MSSLSKQIEEYIKALLQEEAEGVVEIQRNLLSEYFHCVPSQINYVLSTRFTPVQGYMVETRRGGGGYVRIVSLQLDEDDDLQDALTDAVGSQLTQSDSEGLTAYLYQQGVITQREMLLFNSMLKDRVMTGIEKSQRDAVRASMMQQVLAMLNMMRHT
ncbi:MAG: CtsR family transcriptional regulator [Peptococcaceae bacterium]|nr:CtsR family transcriptional regulator [Peptococcaceae bacterium]MBR2627200.1 CtsR family transcriptional regulator [Peptococcaceae bacterium]